MTTWYHRGPQALRATRVAIADFSLRRAKAMYVSVKQFRYFWINVLKIKYLD